jgi:hypothetical protein
MKFIFYFLSFLCMTAPAFANDYSRVIEDLPLMTGMTEIADAAVQFDTIGGRVMETAAEVQSGQKQVYSFYANTLPQLGWTRIAGGYMAYQRAGEMLTIEAVPGSAPGKTRVQFRLGPNSNK